jgi:hypothetical protein
MNAVTQVLTSSCEVKAESIEALSMLYWTLGMCCESSLGSGEFTFDEE